METGVAVQVPLFIEVGERSVDTTGHYVQRFRLAFGPKARLVPWEWAR